MKISSITKKGTTCDYNSHKISIIDDKYFIIGDGFEGRLSPLEPSESFVNYVEKNIKLNQKNDYVDLIKKSERNFLFEGVYGETSGMVFEIYENKIEGASVGEIEIWLYREGELTELSYKQNRRPRIGNFKTTPMTPVLFNYDLKKDDILIVGTVYLFNYIPLMNIKDTINNKDFNSINSCLLKMATVDNSLEDNFSSILIKI